MKIDRSKVKKGTSEVPEDCRKIITFLKTCTERELLEELRNINVWYFGKCELYHWIDVLDRFDGMLSEIAKPVDGKQWVFHFDVLDEIHGKEHGVQHQQVVFQILKFTALLIEHSYARHLYNSIEHLITLLDCADGNIILAVLNLVYVFSKRSNYLTRLPADKKKQLQEKLVDLAQTWGGSEAGCALQQCCSQDIPIGAGNVYFEYYLTDDQVISSTESKSNGKQSSNRFCIDMKNVHEMATNVGVIMENIVKTKKLPSNLLMSFYHRLRLAHAMANYEKRLQFVQARLLALSVLVYSNATVHVNTLVYDGLIEEIVNTLKIPDYSNQLAEVKASCLKTLTAIIFLDRNPRLQAIIDATGATSYHGFLPSLVRKCILHMTNPEYENFPQQLATALFSFMYHLASYEAGCEALVASSLIEPLLKVVLWPGQDDHITFVTRAVRVIDLITNLDMAAFQTHNGLSALVGRLQREVNLCSAYHGPILSTDLPLVLNSDNMTDDGSSSPTTTETNSEHSTTLDSGSGDLNSADASSADGNSVDGNSLDFGPSPATLDTQYPTSSSSSSSSAPATSLPSGLNPSDVEMKETNPLVSIDQRKPAVPCQYLPQRAALLKSILNFLKKAIPDPAFADNTRSLMDDTLQTSLKLIISNAEYYGALLFLLATDVVTVFIFHEPSLLSSLQDSGLTWVVLKALIVKDVPATRENLASLPNTLSALCLNTRGLQAFVNCKPFERLFRILISPEYLPAMKRRRSSDPQGDTAMHLGSAMDELMRHQPTLKTDAIKAIIQLLEQLNAMGHNDSIIAFQPTDKAKPSVKSFQKETDSANESTTGNEDPLSDDEMEEEYRSILIRRSDQKAKDEEMMTTKAISDKKMFVPVVDYVLNVTKFLDNILSNNGTDDHCVEFVQLGGLIPLYRLLNMPNFPLEFPLMPACQSIAQVCKSVAMLAQENKVFKEGLIQLNNLVDELDSLWTSKNTNSSVLLCELANTNNPHEALYESTQTPLVHAMSAIHAYINVFVFICRGAQTDVRTMAVQQWGSDLGKVVLEKLSNLYTRLVWESTILLTLCTPNTIAEEDLSFAQTDLKSLTEKNIPRDETTPDGKKQMSQLTLMKWLLTSSSHLGRALAELFGLLVNHCAGTQTPRMRRHPHNLNLPTAPSAPARTISTLLTNGFVQGLKWKCPENMKLPRLQLTFHTCSVGFLTPMLFDNLKNPYHLMLQQFELSGGIDALFARFNTILEIYLQDKTDQEIKEAVGLGEFLEGWLDLINRMLNTKLVFESSHLLPTSSTLPGFVPFDVVQYMARLHKHAFETIMTLWKPETLKRCAETHGIAEQMLSILCHIIKGEKQLLEKFNQQSKQKEKTEKNALSEIQKTPAPTTFHVQVEVNSQYLQQFVDMGFSQESAREALLNSRNNFEAATEYLLTTAAPMSTSTATSTTQQGSTEMDVDMSEDDMMVQAIAMSLGQGASAGDSSSQAAGSDEAKSPAAKKKLSKSTDSTRSSSGGTSSGGKPSQKLMKTQLDDFSESIFNYTYYILTGCLNLLDSVPSTVHNVCDLLLAISHRNGTPWTNNTLNQIVEEIVQEIENAFAFEFEVVEPEPEEKLRLLSESLHAKKVTVRLHLFLLLFQDLQNSCAHWFQQAGCAPLLINLLEHITSAMATVQKKKKECPTPDMLAPLLLIFDNYEKAALFWKRKHGQTHSNVWKWFDDRSGRWCNYSVSNNTSIDTAYHNGEDTVKFTAGRRRYMVFFKTLVQINEDTGNRRPIMLEILPDKKGKDKELAKTNTVGTLPGKVESNEDMPQNSAHLLLPTPLATDKTPKSTKRKLENDKRTMDVDKKSVKDKEKLEKESNIEIVGLYSFQIELILESTRELLGLPVNPVTLNAIMRLSLRITRDHDMACEFTYRGGIEYLLNLKESSSFPGALPLVTLLVRHIIENKETLKHAVERAVAIAANNGVPNMFCGVGQNSLGAKELHYLLRALGPIACRNSEIYIESTKKIMKLVLPNSRRGQMEDHIAPNSPKIVKVSQDMKTIGLDGEVAPHPAMEKLLNLLLAALVERYHYENELMQNAQASTDATTAGAVETKKSEEKIKAKQNAEKKIPFTPQSTLVRRLTGEHIDEEDMTGSLNNVSSAKVAAAAATPTAQLDSDSTKTKGNDKHFLSLAVILRLLTELSKSYAAVARFTAEYMYGSEKNSKSPVELSILGFIFDKLLPPNKDKESPAETKEGKATTVSTLSRQLLSVLGSYWHNIEIQNIFVTELKGALFRALQLPECKPKHIRLQAIFNLITSMVETAAPISFSSHPPLQNISFIKILIKRGVIADLARCTHSLDLSSQDLVSTVNVMLKPLEKLSNLANSQALQGGSSKGEDKETKQVGTSTTNQSSDRTSTESQTMTSSTGTSTTNQNTSSTTNTTNNTRTGLIQDLEDIVEVMLGNDSNDIYGENLGTNQSGDNSEEHRIFISNTMADSSDDSSVDSSDIDNQSDSDNNNDAHSDNHSEESRDGDNTISAVGDGNLGTNADEDDDEDRVDGSSQANGDVDESARGRSGNEVFDFIIDNQDADQDDTQMEETFLMDTGDDNEDEGDDGLHGGEEEDDTDDEECNDDEGSELSENDDTIPVADDAILFGEEGEVTDDISDPFADLDDHTAALESSYPRRPLTMHVPQLVTDMGGNSSSQARSSILNHPLLLRSEPAPRASLTQRTARNRTHRGDRVFARQQGNTIHVHGNSNTGSFARVLIDEDLHSMNQTDPGAFNDDIFFDIFGDSNETSSGMLNSVPSALSRWTVESRLLDGASVHDCVNSFKLEIVDYLEKLQETELKEKVAEEKAKKEEADRKKKAEAEKASSSKESTSNETVPKSEAVTSTTNVGAATDDVSSSTQSTSTGVISSASLTAVTSASTVVDVVFGSEPMDVSTSSSSSRFYDGPPTPYIDTSVSSTTPLLQDVLVTPSVQSVQSHVSSIQSLIQDTPQTGILADYITPMNPLPEVVPNAPVREPAQNNVNTQPPPLPTLNMADILSVPSTTVSDVPFETPQNAALSSLTANAGGFTASLDFSVNTSPSRVNNDSITSSSNLPSVASILATPANIPSLSQLRSSTLFPATAEPASPPSRATTTVDNSAEGTPTNTNSSDQEADNQSATGTNVLAADLAAAIMSQLVTSSPTPVVTTTAQTVDAITTVSATTTVATTSSSMSGDASTQDGATATAASEAVEDPLTTPGPGPSGVLRAAEQIQRELEGLGIPEGVDPSFLAALPDSIREEVLREQFGIRLRTAQGGAESPQQARDSTAGPPQEVSPEFLAALPPEVQTEVLEQQQLEQARFNASQQRPEQPVDAAEFVRNLNPSLRRQVLADMDDSVLAVLPAELSLEAQGLRQEVEQRRMQLQVERTLTRSDFSQLLRHSGLAHRTPGGGFQFARLFPRGQMNSWRVTDGPTSNNAAGNKKVGRQLLDPESLTCLLVLLFLNDSTLNASRLHRILRNLSYHSLTKQWIIFALISILGRTSSFHQENTSNIKLSNDQTTCKSRANKQKQKQQNENLVCEEVAPNSDQIVHNQWLSRTLNLAFGDCINIFQFENVGKKTTDNFVAIHHQACLDVCKQTLEALSFLAKNFPASFSPQLENEKKNSAAGGSSGGADEAGPSRNKEYSSDIDTQSEFWDILVRLNSTSSGLKGKGPAKTLKEFPKEKECTSFVSSPLGQILSMLSQSVVKQSIMLTDKLLRLLAVISMSLPERPKNLQAQSVDVNHESSSVARPPDVADLEDISQPIHTVTFADTDDVLATTTDQPVLPPDDDETERRTEAGTVCSETASVTSSLYVEPPENNDNRILLPNYLRSSWPGSVVSAFSDGTVAQSDISEATAEQIRAEHESMDVDNASHPRSDTSSADNRSSPALSVGQLSPEKEPSILLGQLRMAVNVLTTGSCSDEGLEDATTLLLQLSRIEPLTRDCILELLLEGAQEIANALQEEIKSLLVELKEHNATHSTPKPADQSKSSKQAVPVIVNPTSARSQPWRGRGGGRVTNVVRRGGGGMSVSQQHQSRRSVPKPIIYDLHLPTMAVLTAKRSNQSLFLFVLKVVFQLREAAQKSAKKPATTRPAQNRSRGIRLIERLHSGANSLREVVAALEADMEVMYEMIDRFGTPSTSSSSRNNANSASTQGGGESSAAGGETAGESGTSDSNDPTTSGETASEKKPEEPQVPQFARLSEQLNLDELWEVLGEALTELAETTDTNAVLVLQPAVESFFLVHGTDKEKDKENASTSSDKKDSLQQMSSLDIPPPSPLSPGGSSSSQGKLQYQSSFSNLPPDTQKFLRFAETHRTVLNQILRQSTNPLAEGPFAVLVNHTRLLDFDVKRRYFRQELEKEDKGHRREDMAVHIRREHVFEDSYRELHRRTPEELKNRLYIVFDGEEGQDAGGLLREWYGIMAREMFNPNYALFTISQGEKATYLPNRNSHCNPNHLSYFKFAGRVVAKAIYDNKLLDCYFTRSFYKHILDKFVHYTDMEAEDYGFYQGLVYLLEHDIDELGYELTFSLEMQVFGMNQVHDLKPNGRNIPVTEDTKRDYVKLVCQEKMTASIRQQIDSFLEGFYEIIPQCLISIFDEQELELLIAGLPTIDIEDLKSNTEYHKYTENSLQIQWFWRALRSFEQADRAKFLQFVTGTSKVPLQGFATLEGMNGVQKFQIHRDDRSTDRLPCAHTCFNQLDLPAYETYDKLHTQLLKAIQECPEGFGLA